MYKDPVNGWGEIIAREESGMDGSVTKTWLIGEVKDVPRNDVLFHIQRQVVQKLDANGKTISCKDDDVNYSLLIYPQNEYSFNVVKPKGGRALIYRFLPPKWLIFNVCRLFLNSCLRGC